MKKQAILLMILMGLTNNVFAGGWTGGHMYVRKQGSVTAVFSNTYTGAGLAWNTWQTVDVTSLGIPAKAKSVQLTGLLIITHGTTEQACDLTVSIRPAGSNGSANNYVGQAVEAHVGGGQRTNLTTWAPLVRGKFEIFLGRNTHGQWPLECSYGVNLNAQAFVM